MSREDPGLLVLFRDVERYSTGLLSSDQSSNLNREESQILALQSIQRLNQRIGMLARKDKERAPDMKTLQTLVNGLTIGIKSANIAQIKYGLVQAKNLIQALQNEP